jgi:hypothetical protein
MAGRQEHDRRTAIAPSFVCAETGGRQDLVCFGHLRRSQVSGLTPKHRRNVPFRHSAFGFDGEIVRDIRRYVCGEPLLTPIPETQ